MQNLELPVLWVEVPRYQIMFVIVKLKENIPATHMAVSFFLNCHEWVLKIFGLLNHEFVESHKQCIQLLLYTHRL